MYRIKDLKLQRFTKGAALGLVAAVFMTVYAGAMAKGSFVGDGQRSVAAWPDTVWQGEGSAEAPYLLVDADALDSLSALALRCDTDFSLVHFRIVADIVANTGFRPVDNFNGVLHGGGHIITYNYSSDADTVGLFRNLGEDAAVDSLVLNGSLQGNSCVGALAGIVRGTVRHVESRMQVSGSRRLGGVAGELAAGALMDSCLGNGCVTALNGFSGGLAAAVAGTMRHCVNRGTVIAGSYSGGVAAQITGKATMAYCVNEADLGSVSASNIGGVVAYSSVDFQGHIIGCENRGSIKAMNYAGGVAARLEGSLNMDSCINSGAVYARSRYGGGITAQLNGNPFATARITACRNYGEVRGGDYLGGIAGFASGFTILRQCFNHGYVEHSGTGGAFLGGLAGMSFGQIQYSGNEGDVTGLGCYAIGGIAGAVEDGFRAFNCYNAGDVTASAAPQRGTRGIAGGIAGDADHAQFMLCNNLGKVHAENNAGGLVGLLHSRCNITVSYNAGAVTGTQPGASARISAVASAAEDADTTSLQMERVYYDSEVCHRVSAFDVRKAIGVSTAELCSNPVGSGFDTVAQCYPLLRNPKPSHRAILASACIGFARSGDHSAGVNDTVFLGRRPQLQWSVNHCFELAEDYIAIPIHRGAGELVVACPSAHLSKVFKVTVLSHMGVEHIEGEDVVLGWYGLDGVACQPCRGGIYLQRIRHADGTEEWRKVLFLQ